MRRPHSTLVGAALAVLGSRGAASTLRSVGFYAVVRALHEAIEEDPTCVKTRVDFGLLVMRGHLPGADKPSPPAPTSPSWAEVHLRKAIALDRANAGVRYALAAALAMCAFDVGENMEISRRLQRLEEAKEELRAGVDLDPSHELREFAEDALSPWQRYGREVLKAIVVGRNVFFGMLKFFMGVVFFHCCIISGGIVLIIGLALYTIIDIAVVCLRQNEYWVLEVGFGAAIRAVRARL